jgi:hypothetical protein
MRVRTRANPYIGAPEKRQILPGKAFLKQIPPPARKTQPTDFIELSVWHSACTWKPGIEAKTGQPP